MCAGDDAAGWGRVSRSWSAPRRWVPAPRRPRCPRASGTRWRSAVSPTRPTSGSPPMAGSSSAEKSGLIKVFQSLTDTHPVVFADLRTQVDDYWDRGLLGLALDPQFPTRPYVYALYTYDAPLGGTPPKWNDACPDPPGPTTDGCVVSGRLIRLTASGNVSTGTPLVLISDWCQQFPSHSVGDLAFGAGRGALRERRRRSELHLRRLRAGEEPVRRPAVGGGRHPDRPHRARAAPCALRTCGRPPIRRGSTGRSCGWIRPRARARPGTRSRAPRTPTPAGSSPTASATRSGSRCAPVRGRCGSGMSAGTSGRRSTAWRRRPRGRRTSAGPAMRAPGCRAAIRRRASPSARASTTRPPRSPRPTTPTSTPRRS